VGERRNAYEILAGRPIEDILEDINLESNTELDLKEADCFGVDWIHPSLDRDHCCALAKTLINLRVPFIHSFIHSFIYIPVAASGSYGIRETLRFASIS
jgi:hypothetical protein